MRDCARARRVPVGLAAGRARRDGEHARRQRRGPRAVRRPRLHGTADGPVGPEPRAMNLRTRLAGALVAALLLLAGPLAGAAHAQSPTTPPSTSPTASSGSSTSNASTSRIQLTHQDAWTALGGE